MSMPFGIDLIPGLSSDVSFHVRGGDTKKVPHKAGWLLL